MATTFFIVLFKITKSYFGNDSFLTSQVVNIIKYYQSLKMELEIILTRRYIHYILLSEMRTKVRIAALVTRFSAMIKMFYIHTAQYGS